MTPARMFLIEFNELCPTLMSRFIKEGLRARDTPWWQFW